MSIAKSPNPPLAYSYIRWSSDAQTLGDSKRRQVDRSRKYAADHGLQLVEQITDAGISAFRGANIAEGKFGTFLAAVKAGKIAPGSYLLVEALDRLSREEIDLSLQLLLDIIRSKIIVVTLSDGYIYKHPVKVQDLLISIISLSRSFEESEMKRQRIAEDWANKRANASTKPMSPICPAWLRLSADKTKFEEIKERAAVVRLIFNDCAAGIGIPSITRRLNEKGIPPIGGRSKGWARASVGHILTNRAVLGEYEPHRIEWEQTPRGKRKRRVSTEVTIPNYFPQIIDKGLFQRAEDARSQNWVGNRPKGGNRGANISNLFSGLLRCAYCHYPMRYLNKGKDKRPYLVCKGTMRGMGCGETGLWRYQEFETSFVSLVREIDFSTIVQSNADSFPRAVLENEIASLRGDLVSIRKEQDRAYKLLEKTGKLDYVAGKLQELEQRTIEVENKIRKKQSELELLTRDARAFSESKDHIKTLLHKLQTYEVRAELSSRLKSLISIIYVANVGWNKPIRDFTISAQDPKVTIAGKDRTHFRRWLKKETSDKFFNVVFKTGAVVTVSPKPDNPMKYSFRIYAREDKEKVAA